MQRKKISIVIPCYFNENNVFPTFEELERVRVILNETVDVEYIFVDDGSGDKTYEKLLEVQKRSPSVVKVVKLTRNFGSSNASLAGMNNATGDCGVILAADLQDPPELIPQMLGYWQNGIKMVVANRIARHDPPMNKVFSSIFHFLMGKFVLKNAIKGGGDLWLIDRQIIDIMVKGNEKNTEWPYYFQWLGFDYMSIPYTRRKRLIGESQWTFSKRVKAFIDSFVSFTFLPLRLIILCGFAFGFGALLYAALILYYHFYRKIPVQGWTSLMFVLLFVSSFIMISLGVIGEYLWRTLDVTRGRPNFIIDKVTDLTNNGNKVS